MRSVEAGLAANLLAGRRGRTVNSPPQFGQMPFSLWSTQSAQKVHSNVQMRASRESGGRSLLQHSQLGRSWSIARFLVAWFAYYGGNHAPRTTPSTTRFALARQVPSKAVGRV